MSAHKFTCRVDGETPEHRTLRIFVNGASAGLLTLRLDEADALQARLAPDFIVHFRTVTTALHSACLVMDSDSRAMALEMVNDARAALAKADAAEIGDGAELGLHIATRGAA